MSDLIEVVFEKISKEFVTQLFIKLLKKTEKISNIKCSEQFISLPNEEISEDIIDKLIEYDCDFTLIVNTKNLKFDNITIPNTLFRLIKYGYDYDVDFNFDYNEIKNVKVPDLINILQNHMKIIASEFGVSSFYGGMDPASDKDTRYFTGEELGPLIS